MIAGVRLTPEVLVALLLAWIGSLAANLYVVGLNQLYDLEIDRVNKPYLPLASGDFSLREGRGIVLASGLVALLIGAGLAGTCWGRWRWSCSSGLSIPSPHCG